MQIVTGERLPTMAAYELIPKYLFTYIDTGELMGVSELGIR
jgi:hypothetical protein